MFVRNVPYIIFAIDETDAPAEFHSWCAGRNLRPIRLVGCYKGQAELSYAIEAHDFWENQMDFWWCAAQESILEVSSSLSRSLPERHAYLQFAKGGEKATAQNRLRIGEREKLGVWIEVTPAVAHTGDAWTLNPATGKYYLAHNPEAF